MTRYIIGLMSGTSVDAIDAALVRITTKPDRRYTAKVLHHTEHPWPKKLRARLLAIMAPAQTTTQELCDLNTRVAHEFAHAVEQLLADSHTPRKKITALASHGQTICHLPPQSKIKNQKPKMGSTLQIGDLSVLATLTGIPAIGNFRPADIALGGQGAPLVPWTDAALLSHPSQSRCIQNIGGIANVTYLPPHNPTRRPPPRAARACVLAFDTGPGNMLMDALISLSTHGKKRYDKNGQLAARGTLDEKLFKHLQSHHYFKRTPPKSTGREDFGQPFAQKLLARLETRNVKLETLLHTATRLTAWSIADAYTRFLPCLPDQLILCGGGADNPTLLRMLTEEFARHKNPPTISRIDHHGIPNKAKEAASFALLAAATLDRIPANLPSVTGASRPTLLGLIAPV
jgi:anhydro-N-acetylmuramic acid kinase